MKMSDIFVVIIDGMLLLFLSAMGLHWLWLLMSGTAMLALLVFSARNRTGQL
jgi:hypothetical protein